MFFWLTHVPRPDLVFPILAESVNSASSLDCSAWLCSNGSSGKVSSLSPCAKDLIQNLKSSHETYGNQTRLCSLICQQTVYQA